MISDEKVAYLDPQEKLWSSQSGRMFTLGELQNTKYSDSLSPFDSISGFESIGMTSYSKTIFRFPLRTTPSELSEVLYDVPKVQKLIDALHEEAKLLLVFLRSVDTIEVYNITSDGSHQLCFKTEIADQDKSSVGSERKRFIKKLKSEYASNSYNISEYFGFSADFKIKVSGTGLSEKQCGESHWLVCNQVGSSNKAVLESAAKQKVFPWVGTALELTNASEKGRIFCFLPMPIEAASNLPVHVNATFGLTNNRRSLKWPGADRKNDPTADWNKAIIKNILPKCYVTLLCKAKQFLSSSDQFYKVWPNEKLVKNTWRELLIPFYKMIFEHPIVWSKGNKEWINVTRGYFIKDELAEVIQQSLASCGIQVVDIFPKNVVAGLRLAGVSKSINEITPRVVRNELKKNSEYTNLSWADKCIILKYCLSDKEYSDLLGLHLLPLLNEKFIQFQKDSPHGVAKVYITSDSCSSSLLPNLSHILVDLAHNDLPLHKNLSKLAVSKNTQVRTLTEGDICELLDKAMPARWKESNLVALPDPDFPLEWFEIFWNWVGKVKRLAMFENKLVLPVTPCSQVTCENPVLFCAIRLNPSQPVVYIPLGHECSGVFKGMLDSLGVAICPQDDFPFVHHKQLKNYTKPYDTNGVLDAIGLSPNFSEVKLNLDQACALKDFLKPSMIEKRASILEKLCIFTTTSGSLKSVHQLKSESTLKKAVVAPFNSCLDISKLPNMMLLSTEQNQRHLLLKLGVDFPSDSEFILGYIFPMIQKKEFPDESIDEIMVCILRDLHKLSRSKRITDSIKNLAFVKISTDSNKSRECPKDLFDPSNSQIKQIIRSTELRFPIYPYNDEKILHVLKKCGLQAVIQPLKILDVIRSIGDSPNQLPKPVKKTKLACAKAILNYICREDFLALVPDEEKFKDQIIDLSTTKSWLPVLATPPSTLKYPPDLKWKGSEYGCHLMSLQSQPCVILSTSNCDKLPLLVGSQMFLSDPPLVPTVAKMLQPSGSNITKHIVSHLREVVDNVNSGNFDSKSLSHLPIMLNHIYRELMNRKPALDSASKWLYIQRKFCFVSPSVVAIEQNPSFRLNLEPYIYLLPEGFLEFNQLFINCGMSNKISEPQILSVLEKIRNEISNKELTISLKEASDLVISILNWLTRNGTKNVSVLVQLGNVYIPIDSDAQELQLENAQEVLYSDSKFLKEYANIVSGTTLTFSHPSIYQKMADCLGLKLLSEKMGICEDDTGQYEALPQRLQNILKGYKDGLTIIKELLQNADDAEATEFNVCFDNRDHNVKKEQLFFQGMAQTHGPALVVHNNRTFSDEDFVNITKLGGATKNEKRLKIGKFGEGFCSVYHITDVPSFVSRDLLHIFDPTLMCLRKEVKNVSKPGKKVKFTQPIFAQSEQLAPYVGLFGFDKKSRYNGTMFRLPFRTTRSELSPKCYSRGTIDDLMEDMKKCASKLILFLQHVNHVTFQRIDNGQAQPTILFEITKSTNLSTSTLPRQVQLNAITLKESQQSSVNTEHWLVATNVSNINGKHATASVASSLNCDISSPTSTYTVNSSLDGEMFCFLPLSQSTGLPVHVSSNFAVMNNRQGIWTSDNNVRDTDVRWNLSVMKMVIPNAYNSLLIALKQMHSAGQVENYLFYSLWPFKSGLRVINPWVEILKPLYELLMKNDLLLSTNKKWLKLQNCKILESGILNQSSEDDTLDCVLKVLTHLNIPLVNLPIQYRQHLSLNHVLITEEEFINLFFRRLSKLDNIRDTRNEVIQTLLDVYAAECDDGTDRSYFLHDYLSREACIPTTPNGVDLKKCDMLIDPDSPFSALYDEEEGFFPDTKLASRQLSHTAFINLGILCDALPWNELIERAQTVPELVKTDRIKGLKRVQLILKCIEQKSKEISKEDHLKIAQLSEISFLPVVPKPEGYPISWKGENVVLSSGSKLTLTGVFDKHSSEKNATIAGSQALFLCESLPDKGGCGLISKAVCNTLNIKFYPTCANAIQQLKELVDTFNSKKSNPEMLKWIETMCNQIYSFLNREISYSQDNNMECPSLESMKIISCVWTGTNFINLERVARNWKIDGPYLFKVPDTLLSQKYLCNKVDIKEQFSQDDVKFSLEEIKKKFGCNSLDEEHREFFYELIPLLQKIKPVQDSDFRVLLPDNNFVLRWSTELVYNDASWAPCSKNYAYVNGCISSSLAKELLIKSVSFEVMDQFVLKEKTFFGSEFGQSEDLTQRIQSILRDYPFDITILKELLQNADDAKATKMYFILDKRFHGTNKVFSENWQKLQGPALLVWNNSTFSDKDLEGIQKLGLGSKETDHESIGQYGIGFNVVYHLTDCPSFVTGDDTLCILDPHCHFIPGATAKAPGRMLGSECWEKYPGIKSAYLKSDKFSDIQGGSLFRFPLRHSEDLVSMSQIIASSSKGQHSIVTAEKMHKFIKTWAPKMKDAMLFLNHVMELKFCVVEENSATTEYHFKTHVDGSAQQERELLHEKVQSFQNKTGSESHLIHYPLTLIDSSPGSHKEEKWIIQQGVGDVNNRQQNWQFVKRVKPKHGLAAPFLSHNSSPTPHPGSFKGQVFCFLPLPIHSNLPVHINGNFILNSTRRELWHSHISDDETKWNTNLIKAIGSSYEKFLVNVQQYFFPHEVYRSPPIDEVHSYYNLFPNKLTYFDRWLPLSDDIYSGLVHFDADIMIIVEGIPNAFCIHWNPCHGQSSLQVHFWKSRNDNEDDLKTIRHILEKLGMKITSAPLSLMAHINEALKKANCKEMVFTSPETVYLYYTENYEQCSPTGFPCAITDSSFTSVTDFKEFTQYTLHEGFEHSGYSFTKPPYHYPLLLTEDEQLHFFDENRKVLRSKFAHFFPECKSYFLHHQLLDVSYTPSYFSKLHDEGGQDGCKQIMDILQRSLPRKLSSSPKVSNTYEKTASKVFMKELWKCLTDDTMFEFYLTDIVKKFAIIPSTTDFLFSTSSLLQPVLANSDSEEVEVLKSIGMPFVDREIVGAANDQINCPKLSDSVEMLKNLYHLFQHNDFSHLMGETQVKTIIQLIQASNFRFNAELIKFVSSLPLYETENGQFTTIYQQTVYIWPAGGAVCDTGHGKWIQHVSTIFLKPNASWMQLGFTDHLGIKTITAEEVYEKFIFQHFSCFTDDERYTHLEHIRDKLFSDNKHLSSRYKKTTNFIPALSNLKCLQGNDNTLKKVVEFCNHKEDIFRFSKKFQFLPDKYREGDEASQWMEFFKELGLRQNVTKDEYLSFCDDVSHGDHNDLLSASAILVKHLFSSAAEQDQWHEDLTFLAKVSEISFVVAERMESLNWIAKPAYGDGNLKFVSPCKSALRECSNLLWTVKPIISLDLPTDVAILNIATISTASLQDIITNINNICTQSGLTNCSLFDTYPVTLKPPENVRGLLDVMLTIFQHLNSIHDGFDPDQLSSLPCVPVPSTPQAERKWQLVLVKPCYVVMSEVEGFHPYLHRLPNELMCVSPLMKNIGVRSSVDLSHIQAILHSAHDQAKGEKMDVNTIKCVNLAIKFLNDLLIAAKKKSSSTHDIERILSPLYLPNREGKLHLSTSLMYSDTSAYRIQLHLNLQDAPYTQLHITSRNYTASDLCSALPVGIRPKKMSEVCEQEVVSLGDDKVHDTPVISKIKKTFQMKLIPVAALAIIEHYMKDKGSRELLKPFIETFMSNFKVITKKNLKTVVKIQESGKQIGDTSRYHFLQHQKNNKCCLYLDSDQFDEVSEPDVIEEISDHVISEVEKQFPQTEPTAMKGISRMLIRLFKVQDDSQIKKLLTKEEISIQANDSDFPLLLELGMEIPSCWHHCLDQDIDNIFFPTDWVGYADGENHIILVEVVHPILPDEYTDFHSIPRLQMKYRICTKSGDLNRTDVSGLDLFKFIHNPTSESSDSLSDNKKVEVKRQKRCKFDEETVKEKIRQELMEIGKLPDEQKKSTIKRLYLKWHPDKNLDNPEFSQKMFTFLQNRIEHLEDVKPDSKGAEGGKVGPGGNGGGEAGERAGEIVVRGEVGGGMVGEGGRGEILGEGGRRGMVEGRGGMVGEGRRGGMVGEGRRGGMVGEGRRGGMVGEGRRGEMVGEGRRGGMVGEGRRGGMVGDGGRGGMVGGGGRGGMVGEGGRGGMVGGGGRGGMVGGGGRGGMVGGGGRGGMVGEGGRGGMVGGGGRGGMVGGGGRGIVRGGGARGRGRSEINSEWYQHFLSWDNTAHDHRHSEQSLNSSWSHYPGASLFFNGPSFEIPQVNVREGWRWMKQADVDFSMLDVINIQAKRDHTLKGFGLVCYLSHQVSEKALQGGVYSFYGEIQIAHHNLLPRASMICQSGQTLSLELIARISSLEGYYLDTRYPNCWPDYEDIPADHFTSSQANEAMESAKLVLETVKNLMINT